MQISSLMLPSALVAVAALTLAPIAPTQSKAEKAESKKAAKKAEEAKKPVIKLVRLSGNYADLPGQAFDPTSLLMGGPPAKQKSFYELVNQLETLAADDSSKTVFFDLSRGFGLNGVQIDEIAHAIAKVRKSGKQCHAYIEQGSINQYQIAAMCDKIHMADMGILQIASPALSVTFMRDALELLGVRMDVVRCGDFKGAVEPYLLSRMSDHLRSHYLAMLKSINHSVVTRIAKLRGIDPKIVRKVQKHGMVRADEALQLGLVDKLVPWEGASRVLKRLAGTEEFELEDALSDGKRKKNANFLSLMNSLMSSKKKRKLDIEGDAIAVLHLSGGIVDGNSASAGSIVSGPAVKAIEELIDNDDVKGVAVRINSPGGSATASEAVRLALQRLSDKKPVVFSMGRVAASGGYWITCIGRPILAQAGTITGSIGVFSMKPNVGPLMRRIGVHEETVSFDEDAANLMSIGKSWTDSSRERMQGFVDRIYDRFLKIAAESREMRVQDVAAIAGGRVWSGEQAKARGLVDEIGGLEDAIAMVAAEAGITEFERVHTPEAPSNMLDSLFGGLASVDSLIPDGVSKLALRRLGNADSVLSVLYDVFENRGPARVWALLPVEIR